MPFSTRAGGVRIAQAQERALGNVRVSPEFLSDANVEGLHRALIGRVYARTSGQAKIDRQSDADLRALMIEHYDPRMSVAHNNATVLEHASRIVMNNLAGYLGYLRDVTASNGSATVLMDRPAATRSTQETASRPVF
jgi:hypothetical protein